MSELKSFIEEINNNACPTFSVISESDVKEFTEEDGKAFFPFVFMGKEYVGVIGEYAGEKKALAYLIANLAERTAPISSQISKEDFFRMAILGEISHFQIEKNAKKFQVPEKPFSVMLISATKGSVLDVVNVIENYSNDGDYSVVLDDKECVLIKFNDCLNGAYQSFTEYAEYLARSIYDEAGIEVDIFVGGTVSKITDVGISYSQAVSAQSIEKNVSGKGGVHSYKEYVFIKMLEDLPKHKLAEYLDILSEENAKEIFSDPEMVETAEEFLNNSLNTSETSRKLFLHRNTLTYRLDKIERATGLNIRKFSDAITFRLITLLSKLIR